MGKTAEKPSNEKAETSTNDVKETQTKAKKEATSNSKKDSDKSSSKKELATTPAAYDSSTYIEPEQIVPVPVEKTKAILAKKTVQAPVRTDDEKKIDKFLAQVGNKCTFTELEKFAFESFGKENITVKKEAGAGKTSGRDLAKLVWKKNKFTADCL